jgi:hypothetical protein
VRASPSREKAAGVHHRGAGHHELHLRPRGSAAAEPHVRRHGSSRPGVQASGPSGNLMVNGAMSFESLYVVNGVVVNENLRGQPNNLFIEDALQETTVRQLHAW